MGRSRTARHLRDNDQRAVGGRLRGRMAQLPPLDRLPQVPDPGPGRQHPSHEEATAALRAEGGGRAGEGGEGVPAEGFQGVSDGCAGGARRRRFSHRRRRVRSSMRARDDRGVLSEPPVRHRLPTDPLESLWDIPPARSSVRKLCGDLVRPPRKGRGPQRESRREDAGEAEMLELHVSPLLREGVRHQGAHCASEPEHGPHPALPLHAPRRGAGGEETRGTRQRAAGHASHRQDAAPHPRHRELRQP
mmetsp:Transcript_25298/g.70743  ORF Transcript_25298/g.70743 Transcript_25298/m.70743 type:complete len:247 (-) Transcript_25298:533-1273(-)